MILAEILISCNNERVNEDEISLEVKPYLVNQEIDSWNVLQGDTLSIIEKNKEETRILTLIADDRNDPKVGQKVLLEDSGRYFIISKLDIEKEAGAFYVYTRSPQMTKEVIFHKSRQTCKRVWFSIHITEPSIINVELGFWPGSIGKASLESFWFYKQEYAFAQPDSMIMLRNDILEQLDLQPFSELTFDENVNQIARSVNLAFLKKGGLDGIKFSSLFASDKFNSPSTSYLHEYANLESIGGSYCQKSSLSVDEMLKLFEIPARQIHWQKECIGFHQFLEYFDNYADRWKIIDPYYGVRYVDPSGEYLGFEEVEKLVREDKFSTQNIEKLNIEAPFYDSDFEIMDGWHSQIQIHILNK